MRGLQFHNDALQSLHRPQRYDLSDIDAIDGVLRAHGTLAFSALPTGLYAASPDAVSSGYDNVWVRDNVYVAFAQWEAGRRAEAIAAAQAMLRFYHGQRARFDAFIEGRADRADAMQRPHVRFNGLTLAENATERWAHAQNDALGYFLWLCARLAMADPVAFEPADGQTLARLVRYCRAIEFWRDEDSGHWEETRKISASSIGVVVAGLTEWRRVLEQRLPVAAALDTEALTLASDLIAHGRRALDDILPAECVQLTSTQNRRYDAALIPLLYPLAVVDGAMADLILHDVEAYLAGPIGVRRYLRDSYWAPDYDTRVAAGDRTRDYSDDLEVRDALLGDVGEEAQWCIFDALISACYGQRVLKRGEDADRGAQTRYFNRALAQVTADWQCPELYYRRGQELVANPHTPLQWAQANLQLALGVMRATTAA